MQIGILGTGSVGQTIGSALIKKGHTVMLGSRSATNEKLIDWKKQNSHSAHAGTFEEATLFGDVIFICVNGAVAKDVLQLAGIENFRNKIVIDVTNPLDFSHGMPPSLLPQYSNTWSLGEEIQKTIAGAFVVKALNTITARLMVDATLVNDANHNLFICGNDVEAKNKVKHVLAENFNWKPELIIDLGDIKYARMTEAIVPFWVAVMTNMGTSLFNYQVVR
ncbi:MAG: NAD(P)-binding domain-containing protein [Lacibacter sp.]